MTEKNLGTQTDEDLKHQCDRDATDADIWPPKI